MIFDCFFIVLCALAVLAWYTITELSAPSSEPEHKPNKLLMILVDGFGWDYFDKFDEDELPGFTKLRKNGVAAEALIPVFPSLSVVNYYSIFTGNFAFQKSDSTCSVALL